jgi:hypothetical protein
MGFSVKVWMLMKIRWINSIAVLCLLAGSELSFAQGVYVIRGENGPIFTNQAVPGAKEVKLPPLSVVPPVKDHRPADATPPPQPPLAAPQNEAAVSAYDSFSIVTPENNGSAAINNAFTVRLSLTPALQLGAGHAFAVSLNGQPLPQRFTSTEFTIPRAFWGDTLPAENQHMLLEASIVDARGEVLQRAAPVRFLGRFVILHPRPLRPSPPLVPPVRRPPPPAVNEPAAPAIVHGLPQKRP